MMASNMHAWGRTSETDRVILDVSGANFIGPFGLVMIASLIEDTKLSGADVDLRLPTSGKVRSSLSRMRLGQALDRMNIDHDLEPVNERPVGDRLLELTRFDEHQSSEDLSEKLHSIFTSDDPNTAKAIYQNVADATDNVCQHSGLDGGWVALHQYESKTKPGGTHVAFAVGDCGFGLRSTLSKYHEVHDDHHAIELAIQRGISGTGEDGRGTGLDAIVTRAREHGGKLQLVSGSASAHTGPTKGSLYPRTASLNPYQYPGTLVYATLDLKTGGEQT